MNRLQRSEIRRQMLMKRHALGIEQVHHKSRQAFDFFVKNYFSNIQSPPRVVGLYSPVRGEVETELFFEFFQKNKIKCAYPKCVNNKNLEYFYVNSPQDLFPGKLGILEPKDGLARSQSLDIVFIPGLCFSKKGDRIGYGSGYFDRWILNKINLKQRSSTLLVGLCYDFQVVNELDLSPEDQKMDVILTENGIYNSK